MGWLAALIILVASAAWNWQQRRRLLAVRRAVSDMASGIPHARAEIAGSDVIGELARAINELGAVTAAVTDDRDHDRRLRRSILDRLDEGVAWIDIMDGMVYANPAWRRLIGISDGRWYDDITDPGLIRLVAQARLSPRAHASVQLSHRGRELIVVVMPDPDVSGSAVLVVRDRSQEVTAEHMRRDVTAAIGHELKTPLTAIMAAADSYADNLPSTVRLDLIARILRHSERLNELIRDVLTLSKLERAEQRHHKEILALDDIVVIACEDHKDVSIAHKIDMVHQCQANALIAGNREELRQLAGNLIGNAIRYNRQAGRVHVTVQQENAQVVLRVADTGIGIPEEFHQRVFDPFFRVDPARGRSAVVAPGMGHSAGGSGLGLAIVKRVADAHGAEIDLNSTNAGTVITVRFPAA